MFFMGKNHELFMVDLSSSQHVKLPEGRRFVELLLVLPSGKRLHSELQNHHAIHGQIHYFWSLIPNVALW